MLKLKLSRRSDSESSGISSPEKNTHSIEKLKKKKEKLKRKERKLKEEVERREGLLPLNKLNLNSDLSINTNKRRLSISDDEKKEFVDVVRLKVADGKIIRYSILLDFSSLE